MDTWIATIIKMKKSGLREREFTARGYADLGPSVGHGATGLRERGAEEVQDLGVVRQQALGGLIALEHGGVALA